MSDSSEALDRFFCRLGRELGGRICKLTGKDLTADQQEGIAEGVLQIMVAELGGFRLTFPDMADYQRMQRDNRIRAQFDGHNHKELSICHKVSPSQVRRAVRVRAKTK